MTPTQALIECLSTLRLRKAQAFAVFLMVECRVRHRNEKIIELLWQSADAVRASASFRQVVRQVRVALAARPEAGVDVETGGGLVSMRLPAGPAPLSVLADDLASTPPGPAQTRLRNFLALLEALQGVSPSLDSWLAITRAQLLAAARRVLDGQMARLSPDQATALAEFAVELEPANEVAVRFLMRADWQAGQASRALARYNALYAHLDEVFDQEPEPETVHLLAAIKLNPAGGASAPVAAQERPQITLCVTVAPAPHLDREAASLAAVLHADLRLRLARFREWRVVDAAAAGPGAVQVHLVPAPDAAGGLQVFVEVTRRGEGELLWSQAILRPEQDWEGKVRPLMAQIANALSVVVADRSQTDRAANVYDRWLKSQALLDDWSPETESRATAMLRDITREAPRFGPAHAELAGALNVRHVLLPGTRQTEEVRQSALHHAIEAVAIDPLDTRAQRVLAWCYCHKGEFGLAEFHFEQALALNRSNPLTLASAALGFAFTHNLEQAAALVDEVRRHAAVMEPFHQIYLAAADYLCGQHARCAEQCRQGAGLMTTVGGWHSAALWQTGQPAAARARLAAWCAEIAAQWHGPLPADVPAVIDWFCAIFPLRREAVRDDLRATLQAVARSGGAG